MTKVVGRINTLKHMYFDVLKRKIQKSHFLSFLWGQIWSKCPHKPNLLWIDTRETIIEVWKEVVEEHPQSNILHLES